MNSLRLAVIGAGHLGRIHARIAAGLPQINLVAVVDPVEESRQRVAEEAGTRALADFRDVVGHVDAAVVATPTCTHHAVGSTLLEQGIPLLIEKPLAATSVEADAMVQLAQRNEVVLQVGHVERFNPALVAVEAELRDPKFIEATRTSGYTFRSTDIGVVLDVMIHDLEIVLSLAKSEVVHVDALGISVLGGHEDMASARITFASGCVAQLTASRISYDVRRTMHVFTGRSYAALDLAAGQATVVRPSDEVLRRRLCLDGIPPQQVPLWKERLFDELLCRRTHTPPPVNAIEEEQREFVACIREQRLPRVNGSVGRDAVAVAEQVLAAIEEHNWDGTLAGRRGPHAMPALPILTGPGAKSWQDADEPLRRAG